MNKKKIISCIILDLLCLFGIFTFFAIPWGFKNYPLHLNWNVFFVLTSNCSGHDSGTGKSILYGFIIPGILVFFIYKTLTLLFIKDKIKLFSQILITSITVFFLSTGLLVISTKFWKYFDIISKVNGSAHKSIFYSENFISENDFKLIPAKNKRNLIYIFLESMEPALATVETGGVLEQDIIPEITKLSQNYLNFGPDKGISGGQNIEGTTWTAAGLFSKTTGLPFFAPFTFNNGKQEMLPKLKKLGNFLSEQDYNLVFSMGSDKQFEDRDTILESQNFEIHDINWYKEHDYLEKNYNVFWGFEDAKLYNFAKKELEDLAIQDKPFAYGMLTVDTHFPYGFKCANCKDNFKEPIENVYACEDKMLADFINWIKEQPWYENTTIVITGDHAYLNAPLNNFITRCSKKSAKEIETSRKFLDIFINEKPVTPTYSTTRTFSSYDMLPTILEAMGNKIEGKGMYLGRSLFSENPTIVELYGDKVVEMETMKKNEIYENLK